MQKPQDSEDQEQLEDQADLSESHAAPLWLIEMRRSMMRGFYHSLGEHALAFMDRGSPDLVVSFDNLSSARDEAVDRGPWGYGFAAKNGFSHLGVMAFRPSWFRDDDLIAELRRLAEGGFFRRFASVTMTGTSMGGYAACAFAALVPGCRVLAFSPQSTLKKSLVPWEERFSSGRKADWSGEFADAAISSAAAGRVWLIYDPLFAPDVRHAQRFTHANTRFLPARYSGHKSALFLRKAGILSTVVRQAVQGDLTVAGFFNSYRQGRSLPWYVHGMAERVIEKRQPRLMARMVSAIRMTHSAPPAPHDRGKGPGRRIAGKGQGTTRRTRARTGVGRRPVYVLAGFARPPARTGRHMDAIRRRPPGRGPAVARPEALGRQTASARSCGADAKALIVSAILK